MSKQAKVSAIIVAAEQNPSLTLPLRRGENDWSNNIILV
jgi:hypothetical protein